MVFPSFFKILLEDFETTLRIPRLFVEKFEDILPQDALLKTTSGESWSVKIERIDNDYCFTHGWPKFVKDHRLQMRDFLVFSPLLWRKSVFKVSIYGASGCEKTLHACLPCSAPSKTAHSAKGEGSTSFIIPETENSIHCAPRFISVLKKHHRSRLRVPNEFGKESGIILKKNVVLKNSKGQSWAVQLKQSRKRGLELAMGWPTFRRENGLLLDGRSCAFKFISAANSIEVHDLGKLKKRP